MFQVRRPYGEGIVRYDGNGVVRREESVHTYVGSGRYNSGVYGTSLKQRGRPGRYTGWREERLITKTSEKDLVEYKDG